MTILAESETFTGFQALFPRSPSKAKRNSFTQWLHEKYTQKYLADLPDSWIAVFHTW